MPIKERFEIYADRTEVVKQRYPAAGDANVLIQLGLLTLADGKTRWMDLGTEADIYLPRVQWQDATRLTWQIQDRKQHRLELHRFHRDSGKAERLRTMQPYQVNAKLMSLAKPSAYFMHCLPAHPGEEVSAEVLASKQSIISSIYSPLHEENSAKKSASLKGNSLSNQFR